MRVVCDIDASDGDRAAVTEACAIAGRRGHVALVCIVGSNPAAALTPARGAAALAQAMRQTRAAGVRSSVYLLRVDRAL